MSQIKWSLIIGGVLALILFMGYREFIQLQQECGRLRVELEDAVSANKALDEFIKKVDAINKRMEEQDEERKKDFTSFNARLRKLAEGNAELKELLTIRIHPDLLTGLRSFSCETPAHTQ